jgi:hypothetical protein
LILEIAPAVAKAAMDSGVATRPIDDFEAYEKLESFVYRSGTVMKPMFDRAIAGSEAHRLRRGRGGARAACSRHGQGRWLGNAHSDWPARRD